MKRWLVVLMMLVAGEAAAQSIGPLPLFSPLRLQIGARLEHTWWSGRDSAVLPSIKFRKEFGAGVVASYALVNNLSATGRVVYYLDSKLFSSSLGLNLLLFDRGQQ